MRPRSAHAIKDSGGNRERIGALEKTDNLGSFGSLRKLSA
jgi:hypothetical protein